MNAKRIPVVLCAAVLASILYAADPWSDKPVSEWNMADTTKLLTNSPWVRDVRLAAPWIEGQPHTLFPMLGGCEGRMDPNEVPSMPSLGPSYQSMVVYRVSWVSSKTYREAQARRAVLCRELEEEDLESTVEQGATEDIVIHIQSPDMTPFEGSDDASVQASTALSGKKSGVKVPPREVQLRRVGGRRVFEALFLFPKSTADGNPIVTSGETELAFTYKSGNTEIKARFPLAKMKRGGEPDL